MLFYYVSPLQLLYLFSYVVFLFISISSSSDFLSFWLFMEFSSLALLCYILSSSLPSHFSSVIINFIVQSISSLGILLVFLSYQYFPTSSALFLIFLSMNIGLFPFNSLYFHSLLNISRMSIFILLTLNKIPSCVMFSQYFQLPSFSLLTPAFTFILIASVILTLFSISFSNSILSLLLLSSIFSNAWLIIFYLLDFSLFSLYFLVYSLVSYSLLFDSHPSPLLLFTLMGLPPLPLFFINLLGVYLIVSSPIAASSLVIFIVLLLLGSAVLCLLYFNHLSSSIKLHFGSLIHL